MVQEWDLLAKRTKKNTEEPEKKPDVILGYNKYMGSVDTSDLLTSVFGDMRRSLKWYKKLIFYINDLAVTNAYILFKQMKKSKITHLNVLLNLIEQLIIDGIEKGKGRPLPQSTGGRPLMKASAVGLKRLEVKHSNHWPESYPVKHKGNRKSKKDCVVCKPDPLGCRKIGGRSVRQSRPQTTQFCPECNVPLHASPCFRIYHTKHDFRCPQNSDM